MAKASSKRWVYAFGGGQADGDGSMKSLLGGKGAALAGMSSAGLPVPPGYTITTDACAVYSKTGSLTATIEKQCDRALKGLEKQTKRKLGDVKKPLLVSVRSGAAISMPGMMDTILNLGLNDQTVLGLEKEVGDRRFALDSYRRLIQMFSDVVLEVPKHSFEAVLDAHKKRRKVKDDVDLNADDMAAVVADFKALVKKAAGRDFPQDAHEQLRLARDAVFRSWNNNRAIEYRRMENIPDDLGTAVNVQAMVFGNKGDDCATGVGFTRDPATGEKVFYGEFLVNAQGEDVVAGVRTPRPIAEMEKVLPEAFAQLKEITTNLERHYGDVQDFEFTIEGGELFMLQTRTGKRTGLAWVRTSVEMVEEGLITKEDAVRRVPASAIDQLLHPVFDPKARLNHEVIATGLPASPGAAAGKVVFTADEARDQAERGERVILVRAETSPDDVHGMKASQGVLTATGGATSHAAVVGRQMGKPSVVGCSAVKFTAKGCKIGNKAIAAGDWLSIDGTTGEVMLGDVPSSDSEVLRALKSKAVAKRSKIYNWFTTILGWADEIRTLGVRCNCDAPEDAKLAVALGAEGIGLCRTEHMFFGADRLASMQKMILAGDDKSRGEALAELLPHQRKDFQGILKAMADLPVTIRTLDPPLHEFLPKREELMVEVARLEAAGKTKGRAYKQKVKLLERVEELHEFNPMLGHRGCRLGTTFPEITRMQARAIFEAAAALAKKGVKVKPEVMIPLVGDHGELAGQRAIVIAEADAVMAKRKVEFEYLVGTMIELPRGALTASKIAEEAEFFSFGTNDLTQTTYGISRDDINKFLPDYIEQGIFKQDPFVSVDEAGVGRLMRIAVDDGRSTRAKIKLGICGEHGGDPQSIDFCHRIGLNYVSCSVLRVPIARLAAAQAALNNA